MQSSLPVLIIVGVIALLFLIQRVFIKKVYKPKTSKMLDQLPYLDEIGLHRDANGYSGSYRDFLVYVYATTSMKSGGIFQSDKFQGNKYQTWVIAAPEKDQLGSLGGFFSNYLVAGKKEGYAMDGFLINFNTSANPVEDIRINLEKIINLLKEKGIKPYVA